MNDKRFTLERGRWYGLTMFPGYMDYPYHSPIRVDAITPLGQRCFRLGFLNLAYAAGVQNFQNVLRTLRRCSTHIVAEETEVADRTYVIVVLNQAWFAQQFPNLPTASFFDGAGQPLDNELRGLAY